jgi:hypothetical protein
LAIGAAGAVAIIAYERMIEYGWIQKILQKVIKQNAKRA